MSKIDFLGSDVLVIVARLRSLADDLERMTVFRPGASELSDAPILDQWVTRYRTGPALVGMVQGHPLLNDGQIVTSEVYAIDAAAGWARTFSRFYRLGPPSNDQSPPRVPKSD